MLSFSRIRNAVVLQFRLAFRPRRKQKVMFQGHLLELDPKWKHEFFYLDYIKNTRIHGPLGIDIWVFSHLVRPGDIVLDAGANIGFTALLAVSAGAVEVHCFEPDPRLIKKLEAHCQGDRLFVYPVALGEKPGSLKLCLSAQHNQGSTLSERQASMFPGVFRGSEFIDVAVDSIDNIFGSKAFDLFKVDVEGAELMALKGGASILGAKPPRVIYIEAYDQFFGEVDEFLTKFYQFRYRVICKRDGSCRLFSVNTGTAEMKDKGFYTDPPSYIYSSLSLQHLASEWSRPNVARSE